MVIDTYLPCTEQTIDRASYANLPPAVKPTFLNAAFDVFLMGMDQVPLVRDPK